MSLLEQTLGELLYEQECVVVPGLGAFLVYRESASIDHVQGLIHPPTKNVRFNTALLEDEHRLFARHLARLSGLGIAAAESHLVKAVEEIQTALSQKQSVPLARVGKLYQDLEGNVRFVSEGTNFDPLSYGLPVLRFYPILRSQTSEKSPLPSEVPVERPGVGLPISRSLLAAATVALLLGLSGLVWWGRRPEKATTPAMAQAAEKPNGSTGPASDTPTQTAVEQANVFSASPAPEVSVDTEHTAARKEEGYEGNEDGKKVNKEKSPEKRYAEEENRHPNATRTPGAEPEGSHIIMVGSFSQTANANRMNKKMQDAGYTPFSDTQRGLHRVGVRLNCSEKELQRQLAEIRRKINKDAWVLDR